MKKRITAIFLCVLMLVMAFAACSGGSNTGSTAENSTSSNESSKQSEASTGDNTPGEAGTGNNGEEPIKLVMLHSFFMSVERDLEEVEAAINEITIPEINVEVDLYPINFTDVATEASLMISSNQQADLIPTRSDIMLSFINKGMLIPLEELVDEYGPDIKAYLGNSLEGGMFSNQLYAVPSLDHMGRTYGLIMVKEMIDKVGWTKTGPTDVNTYEDIDELFAKIDEAYPDLGSILYFNSTARNFGQFNPIDDLGADTACGVLMNGGVDNTTVVNLYATEEYKQHCMKMHEWFLKGYINQDAATSTEMGQNQITAGNAAAVLMFSELNNVSSQSTGIGKEMIRVNTRGHYLAQQDLRDNLYSISSTCEHPEAAMKFLNLMFKDPRLVNLNSYGVEGLDYRILDDGRADYLEGEGPNTCGYHMWVGKCGALKNGLVFTPEDPDYFEQADAFDAELNESNTSLALGYGFNPDVVKTQYSAVTDVITRYASSLETGAVDPEEVLPQFIADLEAAGINDIIALNQQQLDEYLANK